MKWYLEVGPEGDVVISTRIRLARNVAEYPFPCKMTVEQGKKVAQLARASLNGSENYEFIDMQKLTPARAMSLAERHLISPEFAQNRDGRALLLSEDESVSIMLNEEDHIRIQTMFSGMQLEKALEAAGNIDDIMDAKLNYAFNENLGYLTQCPTNLGTGLRASLMLHLPAIAQSGAIPNLANAVSKLGFTVRGTYGEGSEAKGAFFQISNQITLGLSEEEAIRNLKDVAGQIISQERAARENLKKLGPQLEDRVWRSYGALSQARMLSADEFMSLISDVRLGVTAGLIQNLKLEEIHLLIYEVQPASLVAAAGRNLDAQGRDVLRAGIVREKIR
ncbi:MAG TPA: protein arginine kinase [Clostridia bacterium]|nr:protein arginine kinase [Clostridia bacterium]